MAACVICGVAREQHQPCAVCDVPISRTVSAPHWRLCPHCASDDANAEWSADDHSHVGSVDVAEDDRRSPALPLAEVIGRRRRRGPPPIKRGQVMTLLVIREHRVVVHRRDRRGHRRGTYSRIEPMSRRQVARAVGCSHTYVNRLYRETFA